MQQMISRLKRKMTSCHKRIGRAALPSLHKNASARPIVFSLVTENRKQRTYSFRYFLSPFILTTPRIKKIIPSVKKKRK